MNQFWRIVSLLAILSYLVIGGVLVFSSLFNRIFPDNYRKPVGLVLMLYGVYRVARYYFNTKAEKDENKPGI